jgi:hypothetical protein
MGSMRYPIKIAPKNGHIIVLENEPSGTLEVARWSGETNEWIGEFGQAIEITPSHWYPCYSFFKSPPGDTPQSSHRNELASRPLAAASPPSTIEKVRSHAGWGLAAGLILAMLVAVIVGAPYVQQTLLHQQVLPASNERDVAKAQSIPETTGLVPSRSSGADELARLKESIAGATKELRQSLQQEHDRAEALATELAQTRQVLAEKKTEALEDPHVVSQPTAVAAENEAAIKPLQSAPPKRRSMTQDVGSGCQHFRTYNPASSTYRGYDGQVHSCP